MAKHLHPYTLREALSEASLFLDEHQHRTGTAQYYWMMYFDLTLTELVSQMGHQVTKDDYDEFQEVLIRVIADEPIQYIRGYEEFMDHRFIVNKHTLIPREDTAGLIDYARDYLHAHPQARVLDIGTGTGILGITISKEFPTTTVVATDISKEALEIAKLNNHHLGANVKFIISDLFQELQGQTFDLILSNPPYISEDELDMMDASVKKYEPKMALFADNQGLAIYQQLAEKVGDHLYSGGRLLLEIGYLQGPSVEGILKQEFPQATIRIEKDLNNLDRYIIMEL